MHELALIRDLGLIWLAALIAGFICARLKQPTIAGYIIAGIAIGPHGLRLISQSEQITVLAEFGVALLLFALGVEVSLRQIFQAGPRVLLVGLTQIVLTTMLAWALSVATGLADTPTSGFLFGYLCALSSTAIVIKVLMDRGETDSLAGRLLIPVLIIQDLSLIPVISLLPTLGQTGAETWSAVAVSMLQACLIIPTVLVGAYVVVPRLLNWVTRSNSRELFLLAAMSLCLGIALISNQLGLSLALGAFLAGIMVSESAYSHHALAEVVPLRDLFSTLFFVSVGLLLDPTFIARHLLEVSLFVAALMVVKILSGAIAASIGGASQWTALTFGVALAQIGEFSFVVLSLGNQLKLVTPDLYNLFFAGAVVTLIASPLLMSAVPTMFRRLASYRALLARDGENGDRVDGTPGRQDHVILCGYGRIGRNLGMALKAHDIPLVVIEMNSNIIENLQAQDIPYVFGDAINTLTLSRAGLRTAAALAVTVPDPMAAAAITDIARRLNPKITIVARAHRTEDIEVFRAAGANAVVQPEFEASIEITRLLLLSLNLSNPDIQQALAAIRTQRYRIFQPDIGEPSLANLLTFSHEEYSGLWFVVPESEFGAVSIGELDIKRRTGASVLAVKRADKILAHPAATTRLEDADELYVVGNAEQLASFERTFQLPRFCPVSEKTTSDIDSDREGDNEQSLSSGM